MNTVTPSVPEVNEQVNFASTSTDPDGNGTITSFEWDFNYNERSLSTAWARR